MSSHYERKWAGWEESDREWVREWAGFVNHDVVCACDTKDTEGETEREREYQGLYSKCIYKKFKPHKSKSTVFDKSKNQNNAFAHSVLKYRMHGSIVLIFLFFKYF